MFGKTGPPLARVCINVLCCLLPAVAAAEQATVAVASNFLSTARLLDTEFRRGNAHDIVLTAASTGKLFAQISHGAPYDIFLAADVERPRRLETSGATVPGSRFTYASGILALASRRHDDCRTVLETGAFTHLAIANPRTAPYGTAAKALLKNLGLWPQVRDKIVYGDNIGQAFQYVHSDTADLGLVAWAQLLSLPETDFRCHWLPPADSYPVMEQQAVLLRRGNTNAAARDFLAYLKTDPARAIIRASGYHAP